MDGDLDSDISDLAIVLGCYGQSPCIGTCCDSDFDEDGDVDISDLSFMLSNYGYDCKPETGEGLTGGGDSLTGGDDPTTEWIRNATVEDIIRWWEAGMPPIGDDYR